ncbi:beta strand repeat-containing protein [Nitrosomonas sp. ANs5]|uniref:beta strand repeat-containing protein n=1 Tax=Nitrosomonas sp. ANs5 TaxID=3423941 RepID=UPI003D344D25
MAQAVEAGVSMAQLADILANTNQFKQDIIGGKVTTAQQVSVLMNNFGLTPDGEAGSPATLAAEFFTARIEGGAGFGAIVLEAVNFLDNTTNEAFAPYSALLNNKALVAALHAESNNISGVADARAILAGVTAAFPTNAEEAAQYLEDIGSGTNPGQTFTLTLNEDNITGTAGNDVFNAPIVDNNNTLQSFDVLNGGAGNDTLNATLNGGTVAPTINDIEVFNIRAVSSSTLNLADVSGAQQIWNSQSTAGTTLEYEEAPIAATFGVRNTTSVTHIESFDDVSGDEDVLNLVVTGAGSAGTAAEVTSNDATDIEGLNVTASGTNYVDLSDFDAIETLTLATSGSLELEVNGTALTDVTITGSGDLELTDGGNFAAVENVAATGFSGDLTLDVSAAVNLASVATGSGDDDITIDGTLLVATGELDIDLGDGENTLRLTGIVGDGELADLVFAGDDLSVAGVSTLSFVDGLTLAAGATLDLDGVSPSGIAFEGIVDIDSNTLLFDNTAAELDLTFEDALDDTNGSGVVDFGDAAETVVINAAGVVGAANVVTFTGEALATLTINLEDNADFVIDGQEALQTVAIDAAGNASTVEASITGDAAEEFSLTTLTLTDSSEDGDATIDVTLTDTVDLNSITLSGGEASDFVIDAAAADFQGAVTLNIGNFGVDEDGNATGSLTYTADTTNNLREVFKFTGDNFGDINITDFRAGVGGNADRLDFSAFEGVTGLDDLNLAFDGVDTTTITSDAFAGTITIVEIGGVDLSTDAFNFVF